MKKEKEIIFDYYYTKPNGKNVCRILNIIYTVGTEIEKVFIYNAVESVIIKKKLLIERIYFLGKEFTAKFAMKSGWNKFACAVYEEILLKEGMETWNTQMNLFKAK
jgi:hypothetical protein